MFTDEYATRQKLSSLWNDPKVETLNTKKKKYVIISDLHLGDGGRADDFQQNEMVLLRALQHYRIHKYNLILLGDIEEFWQFELPQIVNRYSDTIYAEIKAYGDMRVHRLYGNHDSEWAIRTDPLRNRAPKVQFAAEALKMRNINGDLNVLLVHGHQGTRNSDKNSWASRFFVRLFKSVKPVARRTKLYAGKSATKSQVPKSYERHFYAWAKENGVLLICGHTHRAMFAGKSYADRLESEIEKFENEMALNQTHAPNSRRENARLRRLRRALFDEQQKGRVIDPTEPGGEPLPCYFNSGCSLYTDGVTAIEIDEDNIRLVKWRNDDSDVDFEVYGEGSILDFAERMNENVQVKEVAA